MSNIDNTNSNSNFSVVDQEQLFTELSPEEGSVIEGGATFKLAFLKVDKAAKEYDIYLNFNGNRVFGTKTVYTGDYFENLNGTSFEFQNGGSVSLWDEDNSLWDSDDDPLGSWSVSTIPGRYWASVSGDGFDYYFEYDIS